MPYPDPAEVAQKVVRKAGAVEAKDEESTVGFMLDEDEESEEENEQAAGRNEPRSNNAPTSASQRQR